MTTFDKREQGFEAKFAHDEEFMFKATARSNKLLGLWAAGQLGLSGAAAASYATALVTDHLESRTIDDIVGKVSGDLADKGVAREQVAQKLQECLHQAWRSSKRTSSETGDHHGTAGSGRWGVSRSGLGKWSGAVACAGAMLVVAGGAEVSATPLTPFRYEAQAQRHCPHDKVVWLDFRKGVYYRKGQKRYGQGFDGSFVCLSEARDGFYRRSLLGLR